jgi:hypothetical protein
MKQAIKASVLALFVAIITGTPGLAQDVEPPFTWKGEGLTSWFSSGGISKDKIKLEISVDEQGMVDGRLHTEGKIRPIKHLFYSEMKQYGFMDARNLVIVFLRIVENNMPVLSIFNGRIVDDRFIYGEVLFIQCKWDSDTARVLGLDDSEATLMEGDELPEKLKAVLKKGVPCGTTVVEGGYVKQND